MTDVLVNRFACAAPGLNVPRKKESSRDMATCAGARIAAAIASEIVKNGYGVAVAAISRPRESVWRFAAVIICIRGFISRASKEVGKRRIRILKDLYDRRKLALPLYFESKLYHL